LFAVLSCSTTYGQDAELERQIAGTWTQGKGIEICIYTNGSFQSKIFHVKPNRTMTLNYEGTWQIKDGFCLMTITNSSGINTTNFEAAGCIDRLKIVKVDKASLVLKSSDMTMAYNRK
jgi:hypothetical protein